MTRKRKMKNLLTSTLFGIVAMCLALGGLSIFGSCAPAPVLGVVAAASASCISQEVSEEISGDLSLRLTEAFDAAEAGTITGEELTLRLREALQTYGAELKEAIVLGTADEMASQLKGVTQLATGAGGAIGVATTIASYIMRELSWRRKRRPEVMAAPA